MNDSRSGTLFESAIHTNPSLSSVQKFNYLKSTLRGQAVQTTASLALTNVNCDNAVALLPERYGKKEKIIQSYIPALLQIPAPLYNVTSLRTFYDSTETYVRGQETLAACVHIWILIYTCSFTDNTVRSKAVHATYP